MLRVLALTLVAFVIDAASSTSKGYHEVELYASRAAVTELTDDTLSKASSRGNRPMVVYFYSKNCAACKQYTPEFDTIANSTKQLFEFGRVDVDANPIAAASHNIAQTPTLLVFKVAMHMPDAMLYLQPLLLQAGRSRGRIETHQEEFGLTEAVQALTDDFLVSPHLSHHPRMVEEMAAALLSVGWVPPIGDSEEHEGARGVEG